MATTATITKDREAASVAKPTVRSVHHVSIRCSDPEEARSYFEDLLGLEFTAALPTEVERGGKRLKALLMLFRMAYGDFISVYHVPDEPKPASYDHLHGLELHFGMKVATEAEWNWWINRIKAANIPIMGPLDHEFQHSIYFPGPGHITLEINWNVDAHDEIIARETAAADESLGRWTAETAALKVRPAKS